jgi:hypothetical protein
MLDIVVVPYVVLSVVVDRMSAKTKIAYARRLADEPRLPSPASRRHLPQTAGDCPLLNICIVL